MLRKRLWLSLALFLAVGTSVWFLKFASSAQEDDSSCPQTFEDWRQWRLAMLTETVGQNYSSGINTIQATFQRCRRELHQLGEKAACFERLRMFSLQKYRTHVKGLSLGLSMSDADYMERMAALGIGSLPEQYLSEDFLRRLDEIGNGSYAAIASEVERIGPSGTIAFPYTSKHLPSVDDAQVSGRLFVYIPGERYDIYSQFGIGLGKDGQFPNSISVITVLKRDQSGKELYPHEVYYNDIWRTRGDRVTIGNRITVNRRMENCFDCHKSPLIPVYPDRETFDYNQFGARLARVNEIMSGVKAAYVGLDAENFGPGIGVASLEGLACAERVQDKTKIEGYLDCNDCHNGKVRGVLNFPSALDLQLPNSTNLVSLFVREYGIMPPTHEDLSPDERDVIYQCLIEDFYGDFKDPHKGRFNKWLLQETCG